MMPNKLGQDQSEASSRLNETLQPYSKQHPPQGETSPRKPALFSLKIRAGTVDTDVVLWHIKATGILTQFPCQLNNSWWGTPVFPEAENHHTSVSGCSSVCATWQLDGNFASWVPPWNLHFDKIPNHKLMFARYQATAHRTKMFCIYWHILLISRAFIHSMKGIHLAIKKYL